MSELRILLIEDTEEDELLLARALRQDGFTPFVQRVETAEAFSAALCEATWDVVLADWTLPRFGALPALELLRTGAVDVPFIVVTGTASDQTAVAAMKAGAHDIVRKDDLARLAPAIAREMRDAAVRVELRAAMEQQRLQALLLSQVNDAIIGTDLQFRIQTWNPAAEAIYGWRTDEVIGRRIREVLPVRRYFGGQTEDTVKAAFRDNGLWSGRTVHPHRDGHDVIIDSAVRFVRNENGEPVGIVAVNRDITARHQAETALRATEERFRLLFEHTAVGMTIVSTDGHIQQANEALLTMLGYTEAELTGQHYQTFTHPDDRVTSEFLVQKARLGEIEHYQVEKRYVRKDGSTLWALLSVATVPDPETGAPSYIVSQIQDITARREAEEALRTSEARFRSLFANARDAIFFTRVNGMIVDANDASLDLFGTTRDELLYLNASDFYADPADRQGFQQVMAQQGAVRDFPLRVRRRDGTVIDTLLSGSVERDQDGHIVGYQGIIRDVTAQKQAAEIVRRSEAYFRALTEHAADSIIVVDANATITYANPSFEHLLGYAPGDRVGRSAFDFIHPEDHPTVSVTLGHLLNHPGEVDTVELRVLAKDGSLRILEVTACNVLDEPAVAGIVCNSRDITERRSAEYQLEFQRTLLAAQTEAALDGILTVGSDGQILSFNQRFAELWNVPEAIIATRSDSAIIQAVLGHLVDPTAFLARINDLYSHPEATSRDEIVLKDGRTFERYSAPVTSPGGLYYGRVWFFRDITERKRSEYQLAHLALHDPLTGLPNRTLFYDRVGQAIERVTRHPERSFSVLFLDLDRFKAVNDSLGHGRGDQLLQEVSRRLERCVRPGDSVARLGGDEFAILLEDLPSIHEATLIAERVQVALAEPVVLDDHVVTVTASIGITVGDGTHTAEDLLRDADIAMYRAKRLGKARFEIFDPAMLDDALARLRVESELRGAIAEHQLVLHYQPIVQTATSQVVGVEALVRWQHPTRGLLGPGEFIPIAEESGLIVPLGTWVLREACRQAVEWQRAGLPPVFVSVNVASEQLRDQAFAQEIAAVLEETGLAAGYLELEITESNAMTDVTLSKRVLSDARALGLRGIAIDDFGTGYSSLSMLQEMPITHVKIDRSFIRDLETKPNNVTLAHTIIAMSHALGCKVIAEGVETVGQQAILHEYGCDKAQGYLFSRPLSAKSLEALLMADLDTGLIPVETPPGRVQQPVEA